MDINSFRYSVEQLPFVGPIAKGVYGLFGLSGQIEAGHQEAINQQMAADAQAHHLLGGIHGSKTPASHNKTKTRRVRRNASHARVKARKR